MNRFEYVLSASPAPQDLPLIQLAAAFMLAVEQTVAEQLDPHTDPAVMILGAYIAFQTHADVNTQDGYYKLLEQCQTRLDNLPTAH